MLPFCLMQVLSIAECSKGSILQYFRPSLSYHLSLRSLICLFLGGSFTVEQPSLSSSASMVAKLGKTQSTRPQNKDPTQNPHNGFISHLCSTLWKHLWSEDPDEIPQNVASHQGFFQFDRRIGLVLIWTQASRDVSCYSFFVLKS